MKSEKRFELCRDLCLVFEPYVFGLFLLLPWSVVPPEPSSMADCDPLLLDGVESVSLWFSLYSIVDCASALLPARSICGLVRPRSILSVLPVP